MRNLRTLLLILLVSSFAASTAMTRRWERWEPNWEFDGVMSTFRGGVGGFLWYPVLQDERTIAFSQIGTGWIRNAYFANYGMGYRQFLNPGLVIGANGFMDVSYSDHEISYYQGGFGLELMGPCWEAQANCYFPQIKQTVVGEKVDRTQAFLVPDPANNGMDIVGIDLRRQAVECSFYGYDALAGAMWDIGPGELWGRVGYYYYRTRGGQSFQGPRFIGEYISKPLVGWGAQLFFGVSWEHDNLHHGQTGAHVGFRIPFCWYSRTRNWCKSSLCRRVAYAVRRQSSVRIERQGRTRFGDPQFLANAFFVEQNGAGTGTQTNPTDLNGATTNAVAGDLIFLLNSAGNITLPAGGINLLGAGLDNAIIAGFGANGSVAQVPVQGRTLRVTALTGQQGRPILTGPEVAVSLANNNRLQGFGVDTATTVATGTTRNNATIEDVVGSNLTGAGAVFTNMTGLVNIANSSFLNVTGNAIEVNDTAAGISNITKIQNTTFNTVDSALTVSVTGLGASADVLFSGNIVTTAAMRGVDVTLTSVAAGATTVNMIANGNMVSGTATEPFNIVTTFVNPNDTFNLLIDGNIIVSPPGAITAVNVDHSGDGRVNATVTNNQESGNATATSAYTIQRTGAAAPGILCTDFTGNNTARPAGVTVDAIPATLQVEQLPQISVLNNNMTVATIGAPADVPTGTCPEPVIP